MNTSLFGGGFLLSANLFQKYLLKWFDQAGRKDLPWQYNKTPYRVWISEIMLQQTQVTTVIPYFERFMAHFPTIEKLACAPEDEVLHYWTGLGYYQRARHLHRAAQIIHHEYAGQFPETLSLLQALPGIGRTTAGAILSIAFEKKGPILDGNVKRVLTRLHGVREYPGDKKVAEQLWRWADEYTPQRRVGDYTQAIMDLGATLCIRGKPRCPECPFVSHCLARAEGIEKLLPISKPRKKLPVRKATLLIFHNENTSAVLLEKRPSRGIWAGLWSLPEILGTASSGDIKKEIKERFQCVVKKVKKEDAFRHTFTHYHLDIQPLLITAQPILADKRYIWYTLHQSQKIGMPAPIKSLLSQLV